MKAEGGLTPPPQSEAPGCLLRTVSLRSGKAVMAAGSCFYYLELLSYYMEHAPYL